MSIMEQLTADTNQFQLTLIFVVCSLYFFFYFLALCVYCTYLVLSGSSSNSINKLHPRMPHGSFSDITNISSAILCNKSDGNNTSVQAKCLCLANLSSFCRRKVNACSASSCGNALTIGIGGSDSIIC